MEIEKERLNELKKQEQLRILKVSKLNIKTYSNYLYLSNTYINILGKRNRK